MRVALFHVGYTHPAPENSIPLHTDTGPVDGPVPSTTHTKTHKPIPPKRLELGLHTLLLSGDGENNNDNDVLNVSGKTLTNLLALMQRNALDFTALKRYDANLDSLPMGTKDTTTRHKQRLFKHGDRSGRTFIGGKAPFPKGRSASAPADVDLPQADHDEHLRAFHKLGSDSQSQVHDIDEVCLVNLRFLPDGSSDFAPETEKESLIAIELLKQLVTPVTETVHFYEHANQARHRYAGGIYDLMHVRHDSYTLTNRLNKGDGATGVQPASREDPALAAATQAILIRPQQSHAEAT